ncbi:hypothetical protein ACFYNO_03695 [Kitasatospora sp. NPDC006697]|uniref:hypothetical protein n=1 Tax=Kitasatospora sp. NPDC006697 TaxID=3364020 RepID=UPI0036CAA398
MIAVLLGLAVACGGPPSAAPAPLGLTEAANGSTVHARVGQQVELRLGSTYWSAVSSSSPQVLQPLTPSSPSPSSPCPPGGGCGTVSSTFRAAAAGTAHLTATRNACGEAKPCLPDQRTYLVTVEVSR